MRILDNKLVVLENLTIQQLEELCCWLPCIGDESYFVFHLELLDEDLEKWIEENKV